MPTQSSLQIQPWDRYDMAESKQSLQELCLDCAKISSYYPDWSLLIKPRSSKQIQKIFLQTYIKRPDVSSMPMNLLVSEIGNVKVIPIDFLNNGCTSGPSMTLDPLEFLYIFYASTHSYSISIFLRLGKIYP